MRPIRPMDEAKRAGWMRTGPSLVVVLADAGLGYVYPLVQLAALGTWLSPHPRAALRPAAP